MIKRFAYNLHQLLHKTWNGYIEQYYRNRAFDFARGLHRVAQTGKFSHRIPEHVKTIEGDPEIRIESWGTGLFFGNPMEPEVHVNVYLGDTLVFEQIGTHTERFNYGRLWVEQLWKLIDEERAKQTAIKQKERAEKFASLEK